MKLAAGQVAKVGRKAAVPGQARVAIDARVPLSDHRTAVPKAGEGVAQRAKRGRQAHARPVLDDAILEARVNLVAAGEERRASGRTDVLRVVTVQQHALGRERVDRRRVELCWLLRTKSTLAECGVEAAPVVD